MVSRTPSWVPGILVEARDPEENMGDLGHELDQYLEIFQPCFHFGQEKYAAAYIKGLMSDLGYKSAESIALYYGLSVRSTQRFMRDGKWHDQRMWDIYRSRLAETIACGGGMITVDVRDNPKKGNGSVGVARQRCGATGKVSNCQSGVYVGYSGERGYGLIDCGLYLPEIWFGDGHKKLREKCEVPECTAFKTKASMAVEMVQHVYSSGLFPARWVGVDSFFGNSREFFSALPEGTWYFADIHPDTLVFHEVPTIAAPVHSGRRHKNFKLIPSAAPVTVEEIAASCGAEWTQIYLGEGSEGPTIYYEKCIRVIRGENNSPGEDVWLYVRKLGNGKHEFSFCNAPLGTPASVIRRAALMRGLLRQCFEECKSYFGLDQYEGRSWNTWHRHNLLVFVTQLFRTCLCNKQKKLRLNIDADVGGHLFSGTQEMDKISRNNAFTPMQLNG